MSKRDELAAVARAFIVGEVGEDLGAGMTEQAERFADAVLAWLAEEIGGNEELRVQTANTLMVMNNLYPDVTMRCA